MCVWLKVAVAYATWILHVKYSKTALNTYSQYSSIDRYGTKPLDAVLKTCALSCQYTGSSKYSDMTNFSTPTLLKIM